MTTNRTINHQIADEPSPHQKLFTKVALEIYAPEGLTPTEDHEDSMTFSIINDILCQKAIELEEVIGAGWYVKVGS